MAAKQVTATVTPEQQESYRLWIDDEWYILVDAAGRCIGKCGEGALGFIVQLSSVRDKTAVRALKIPRLVAETERENAYIAELLALELAAVRDVFDKPGDKSGLVGARDVSSPFQGTLRVERYEDARTWNGALLLVRFEKGENPYFCLVHKDHPAPHPPQAKVPKLDSSIFDQIRDVSRSSSHIAGHQQEHWSQMVFLRSQPDGEQIGPNSSTFIQANSISVFSASDALAPAQLSAGRVWYTCIPSVTYDWAPNTLQEAIGRGERGGRWSIDDHLQLVEQICKGVKVLHNKRMLHADIRPANIVYLGDAKNPTNYYLSDYGSFAHSNERPLHAETSDPEGGTIAGPVVEGERVSPFYAPERGSGRERETADTAIIVLKDTSTVCYAIAGWKSELMELGLLDEVAKPTLDADGYSRFVNDRRSMFSKEGAVESALDNGDRVQLRDYIFELNAPEEIFGNIQVFHCSPKFWTIYHDRIAISESRNWPTCFSFPIPRIIELPQWSAATDIYSLGVLCLYSVYSELLGHGPSVQQRQRVADYDETRAEGHQDNHDSEYEEFGREAIGTPERFANQDLTDVPKVQTSDKASTVKLDDDFEVMLKYMADKSLFRALWPQLEWLRFQIEEKLVEQERQNWTAEKLAKFPYQPKRELEPSDDSQSKIETSSEPRTLQSETIKVISQITSTVPGIAHLLRPLSEDANGAADIYQLGPFIFFLHFVLCCLHRQDSLDSEKLGWVADGWMKAPFCRDRHDPPKDGAAADQALLRLAQIRSLIKAGALRGLICEKTKIAPFDLRPENEIRREINELRDNARKLSEQLTHYKDREAELAERLSEYSLIQARLQQTEQELAEARGTIDSIRADLTRSCEEMETNLQAQLATNQSTLEQYRATIRALETSFNSAIKTVADANALRFAANRQAIVDEMTRQFVDVRKQISVD